MTSTHLKIRQAAFEFALNQTQMQLQAPKGIGTLNEKTIHAVFKNFYAPYPLYQEQRLAGYVADIFTGTQVIEIQTRNFNQLRKKLDAFLPLYDVTIVHPIAAIKWVLWIDETTGEVSKKRKSPKKGSIYQLIPELYKLRPYLKHPHLHFICPLIEVEEYRLLNGWSVNKKKGASREDGIPTQLIDEIYIHTVKDYEQLLPTGLPLIFTSKDYQKASKVQPRYASTALQILNELGLVTRIGKQGNAYLYECSI